MRGSPSEPDFRWHEHWLMRLCAEDSTSGREDALLPPLLALLDGLGADVRLQEVAPGRTNVLACWGSPRVLLTTHLDTVAPYLPPEREGGVVRGRGTCDAKGQLVAQLAALASLLHAGREHFAWLGVVGEETDSAGASLAPRLSSHLPHLRALINGEPTGLRLAAGQRGVAHLRLRVQGRTAHSSTPELGRSAAWHLMAWLTRLRRLPLLHDSALGAESWNLGRLRSGSAPNVVPGRAEAHLLARVVPGSTLLSGIHRLAPRGGRVSVRQQDPPFRFTPVPGFPHTAVPFGSDAPQLAALVPEGAVVMAGPGDIRRAHSAREHIHLHELRAGAELFRRLVCHFLDGTAPAPVSPFISGGSS